MLLWPDTVHAWDLKACWYAVQGNLVLTDSNYEILTLLRSYRDDVKGYAIMPRHPYPIRTVRPRVRVTEEAVAEALIKAGSKTSTLKGVL